ncbi:hypothetical protein PPYR_15011, partial [Photinus pyralis]
LPTPEDIFASLGGSRYFSIIDLKGAYQQLEVDPQSSPLLTINTHKGLFRFKRLTYGISSAPAIFSAAMPTILSGLPCRNYLDDILVFGDSLQSCYENVIKVLSRLQEYNVKANEKKCQLFKKQVDFLGHRIDEVGIHPLPDKVKCIKECPVPQNVTQLKAYLGLINYYGKFCPMLSTVLKCLYELCKKDVDFNWDKNCDVAFERSKELITSDKVLTHYNPSHPLYLTCDASAYGVGAVLSHRINGLEKPINLFHKEHIGVVRSKMLLRSYCWWPCINEDLEQFISKCESCQINQKCNKSSFVSWSPSINDFQRVHIDFFYKFGYTFLILVDSKSKWIEVKLMDEGTSAKETILKLKEMFSVFGLPVSLVSDNGPPFTSSEFISFCHANGINCLKSPPYHPQSNGCAERGVQTVKKSLEKSLFSKDRSMISKPLVQSKLANFLFEYRNTPSTSTGLSPSQIIFKSKPRTRFDLLRPGNQCAKPISNLERKLYNVNESVLVRNKHSQVWEKGKILKNLSFCTHLVLVNGNVKMFHADNIRTSTLQSKVTPFLPLETAFDRNVLSSSAQLSPPNVATENMTPSEGEFEKTTLSSVTLVAPQSTPDELDLQSLR